MDGQQPSKILVKTRPIVGLHLSSLFKEFEHRYGMLCLFLAGFTLPAKSGICGQGAGNADLPIFQLSTFASPELNLHPGRSIHPDAARDVALYVLCNAGMLLADVH